MSRSSLLVMAACAAGGVAFQTVGDAFTFDSCHLHIDVEKHTGRSVEDFAGMVADGSLQPELLSKLDSIFKGLYLSDRERRNILRIKKAVDEKHQEGHSARIEKLQKEWKTAAKNYNKAAQHNLNIRKGLTEKDGNKAAKGGPDWNNQEVDLLVKLQVAADKVNKAQRNMIEELAVAAEQKFVTPPQEKFEGFSLKDLKKVVEAKLDPNHSDRQFLAKLQATDVQEDRLGKGVPAGSQRWFHSDPTPFKPFPWLDDFGEQPLSDKEKAKQKEIEKSWKAHLGAWRKQLWEWLLVNGEPTKNADGKFKPHPCVQAMEHATETCGPRATTQLAVLAYTQAPYENLGSVYGGVYRSFPGKYVTASIRFGCPVEGDVQEVATWALESAANLDTTLKWWVDSPQGGAKTCTNAAEFGETWKQLTSKHCHWTFWGSNKHETKVTENERDKRKKASSTIAVGAGLAWELPGARLLADVGLLRNDATVLDIAQQLAKRLDEVKGERKCSVGETPEDRENPGVGCWCADPKDDDNGTYCGAYDECTVTGTFLSTYSCQPKAPQKVGFLASIFGKKRAASPATKEKKEPTTLAGMMKGMGIPHRSKSVWKRAHPDELPLEQQAKAIKLFLQQIGQGNPAEDPAAWLGDLKKAETEAFKRGREYRGTFWTTLLAEASKNQRALLALRGNHEFMVLMRERAPAKLVSAFRAKAETMLQVKVPAYLQLWKQQNWPGGGVPGSEGGAPPAGQQPPPASGFCSAPQGVPVGPKELHQPLEG